ncbi:hypothetical protein [Aquimarina macrocephali]|uniref:hypothetical protein n=1 Tax=Aquimarina macrocephali TaxID=666563 RepID=UPI0004648C3C|nr:hypothetical protein [Aquimarina macrocephali]
MNLSFVKYYSFRVLITLISALFLGNKANADTTSYNNLVTESFSIHSVDSDTDLEYKDQTFIDSIDFDEFEDREEEEYSKSAFCTFLNRKVTTKNNDDFNKKNYRFSAVKSKYYILYCCLKVYS